MELKRVVVTGLGAVTPVGNNPEETWKNLLEGVSGAAPITHFDASQFKTQFACEVKGFNVNDYIDRKEARKMDRYAQLAMASAVQAVEDSKMDLESVDKNRIGIWGWSYGGFNTLMSMSEGRGVFRAGVAIAPPTNWKFYDSVYTERYMRTPKENPDGYATNPIERASKLHGALLICHGTADDNVHPQNAYEYSEALVQADKDFRELYYTNRNHSIYGGNTRNHLLRQVAQFFQTELR